MPIALITVNRLSSKKIPSLKLPSTFPALILEEKVFTMSWNNQVSTKESRDLVSGAENISKSI